MTNIPVIVPDRTNYVAFHDLHVVDVVQQLESVGPHLLRERHSPRRVIAMVVGVVDLRVEKLHAERHAVTPRGWKQWKESARAVVSPSIVRDPTAISRKANQVGDSRRRCEGNR